MEETLQFLPSCLLTTITVLADPGTPGGMPTARWNGHGAVPGWSFSRTMKVPRFGRGKVARHGSKASDIIG